MSISSLPFPFISITKSPLKTSPWLFSVLLNPPKRNQWGLWLHNECLDNIQSVMVCKGNIASLCYIVQIYQPHALRCNHRIFLLVLLGEWICLNKWVLGISTTFFMYRWVAESAESFCCWDFFLTTRCSDANGDGDN